MRIQSSPNGADLRGVAAARAIGLDPSVIIAGTMVYEEVNGNALVRWEQLRALTPEEAEMFKQAWIGRGE